MIRKISLAFNAQELEKQFRQWSHQKQKYQFAFSSIFFLVYLVLLIIYFDSFKQGGAAGLVASCITLFLEVLLLIISRKYPEKMELFFMVNYILAAAYTQIIRIFCTNDRWALGTQLTLLRLGHFMQGNRFLEQSSLLVAAEGCGFIYLENYTVLQIIQHLLFIAGMIVMRYSLEFKRREHFLNTKLKEQYENLLVDLLPSWVVLVKYDKFQAQLIIEKINKEFKARQEIENSGQFREFLRKLHVTKEVLGGTQTGEQIRLEPVIIRLLQQKSEENYSQETRYLGVIEKDKRTVFKITQVYFNKLEPTVMLLFEEVHEDKYEQLQQNILWRDQQTATHSKILLRTLSNSITVLNYVRVQIPQWAAKNGQHFLNASTSIILSSVQNSVQQSYLAFNQTFNQLNLLKLSYSQIKYEVSQFELRNLLDQLKEDLSLRIIHTSTSQLMMRTDRGKLVSIIVSIIEFMRFMLAIHNNDERLLNEVTPLSQAIHIKVKQHNSDSYQISFAHPKLSVPESLIECLSHFVGATDHRKRHWGATQYFKTIRHLSDEIQRYAEARRVHTKASAESFEPIQFRSDSLSTLGYPIAQYLVSQLGPFNKIFVTIPKENPESFRPQNMTKIKVYLYKDLSKFIEELNSHQPNPLLDLYTRPSNHLIMARSPNKKPSSIKLH